MRVGNRLGEVVLYEEKDEKWLCFEPDNGWFHLMPSCILQADFPLLNYSSNGNYVWPFTVCVILPYNF